MKNKDKAQKIANYLFRNGNGEKAKRLVLEITNGRMGGGWGEKSVADAIEKMLNKFDKDATTPTKRRSARA